MNNRISLGQYYSVDSVIHRLDPRLKIRFVLCYIILLFIGRTVPLFAFLSVICALALIMSKVPPAHLVKGTGKLMLIMCLLNLVNLFTAYGDVLIKLGFIRITREGAERYALILWRFVLLIVMASLLMYTTLPSQLSDGFAKCFRLKGETAMSVTIALRFIPLLAGELDSVRMAVKSRGVDFKSGSVKHRLSAFKYMAVPMFQSAVDKAGNLSEAMEARCYRGAKGRTRLKRLAYGGNDIVGYVILLLVIAGAVWIKVKL
ncbi:MAG: energy-coupling factor transporter transmembrane protein EcfT [Lachnospiraceae bacterium]|nr:energy-coupling factor transporter transmembrane protein EcfT [Lachnospiraceae bacterium]